MESATGGASGPAGPLEITVTDPVKQGDGVNAYTSYRVTSKSPRSEGEVYVIRRFSDFQWLHDRLGALWPGVVLPPLPDKNVVEKFRFSEGFVEARRRALEAFVRRVARHPVVGAASELQHFLRDSEDTWTMEMRKTSETKVLGAKSSDILGMFQSVQQSLASAVLGREDAPEERDTDRLRRYADGWERCLADCHRDAVKFVRKQQELGGSLCQFAGALQAMGQWEEGPLGRCFAEVGTKADIVGNATRSNAQVFLENLEEPLKDYIRLVHSLKKAISDRSAAWSRLQGLEADLRGKRAKRERAAAAFKQDKVQEAEAEIAELTVKVEAAGKEHREVAERLNAEVKRCHGEMAVDFMAMFQQFKAAQVRIQRQTAHSWESLQPMLRAAAAEIRPAAAGAAPGLQPGFSPPASAAT